MFFKFIASPEALQGFKKNKKLSNIVIKCDVKSSVLKNKKRCQRRKAERQTQKKKEEGRTMKIRQQRTKEGEADTRKGVGGAEGQEDTEEVHKDNKSP